MTNLAHSKIGASSCYRWWECPGSVALSQDVIRVTSAYASEGTAAHEVCEVSLKNWEHPSVVLDKNTRIGVKADDDMVNAAEVLMEEIAEDFFKHFGFNPEAGKLKDYLFVEKSFDLSHIKPGMFGTNDACLLIPFTKLYVYDFKYGQGIAVEAKDNKQLMYYAIGALEGHDDIQEVELVIVQPRAFHPAGAVRRHVITRRELEDFKAELTVHAEEALTPGACLKAGHWCKFCPALAICPEVAKTATELAKTDFTKSTATLPNLPAVESLTVEQLAAVLSKADLLGDWIKGVEAYAQGLLEVGRKVPGFKLVRKRSTRKWSDEERVLKAFAHLGQDRYETKVKSPAQMEKLVGKAALEGLTFMPDTGLTIVLVTDKREAADNNAVADFRGK